jgi:uncharacterized membrane protein YczE
MSDPARPDPAMQLLRRPLRDTLLRLPQVVAGLVTFGIGISMLLVAELGNAPWDVLHQGLAEVLGLSIGGVIIGVGLLLVLAFVPLREPVGVGTLLNAVLVGLTANLVLAQVAVPDELWVRVALMLAAPAVVGLGSGLYIGSGLGSGPRDGLMTGIARRGFATWKVRTSIEASVLVGGVLLGGRAGVGTLWFVLAVGPCVHWFLERFGGLGATALPVPVERA